MVKTKRLYKLYVESPQLKSQYNRAGQGFMAFLATSKQDAAKQFKRLHKGKGKVLDFLTPY